MMFRTRSNEWSNRLAPTRRDALGALASTGVLTVPFVIPPNPARASEEHPLHFTYAGYDIPEFYPDYVEKYGSPPEFTFFETEDEAIAKMRAGFRPDTVFPCTYKIETWYDAGLIGPIDTSMLSNWPDIFDSLKDIQGTVRDGERVLVPADWGQTSVTFRTDLAPEYVGNETLDIMWDPKYAGRLAMFDSIVDGVLFAAIRLGIDPFNMDIAEIEAVRASLEEQRSLLRYYSNNFGLIEEGLASGELVAATTWTGSFVRLAEENIPVRFMDPREGKMTWVCGLAICPWTEHREKAHELIDAFISPQAGAIDIADYGYGSANRKAFELVDEETLELLGMSGDPEALLEQGVFQVRIKNEEEIVAMFEEVKAGI